MSASAAETSGWSIAGARGEMVLGDAHVPAGSARGVVLLAHGFKGYKDYGMFPRLADVCASAGFIAHRYNFSHSGMTNDIATFARPDLFELDTWSTQVLDAYAVMRAVADGTLAGAGLPMILFGHSRGGLTSLLTAGRGAGDPDLPQLAGVVTAAAPARCNSLPEDAQQLLLAQGFLPSPSSRTGQELRVGRGALQEVLDDPEAHDVVALAARIECPVLLVHGRDDPTVPCQSAEEIADAIGAGARTRIVDGANHVFNTPNPLPADAAPSPELQTLIDELLAFMARVTA